MQKSKLVQLLQSCNSTELVKLEDFIGSAYFNKDQQVILLFQYLKRFHPDFQAKAALSKAAVFSSIFPDQAYDDKQLRYLMSDLKKLIQRFFTIEKMEDHAYHPEIMLLDTLSERGLEKTYQRIDRLLEKKLGEGLENSSDLFYAQLKWAEVKEDHFQRKRLRQYNPNIQYAAQYLDRYYFLQRLKLTCAMLDRQSIFQNPYELHLTASWIQHLEKHNFFDEPIIRLYSTIFKALQNEQHEEHFTSLTAFMKDYAANIPRKELADIHLFAINYCARKIRQGKETYIAEALNLYRTGIESGVLIADGVLSPWAFTNVVKLSLRLKQYDQIESFIQQYAPLLPEAFRSNALHYNLAELYYYTQRFVEAQQQLMEVTFSDMNYYLGARVLLAKIYYELDEEEPLLSLIASFTIFLKRNKELSNNLKQTYLNFCDILFKIMRQNPRQMKQLATKIKSTKLLTDRAWLLSIYQEATT